MSLDLCRSAPQVPASGDVAMPLSSSARSVLSYAGFTVAREPDSAGRVRLELCGELDIAVADDVREIVASELAAGASLVIDLTGLRFMDSRGVAALFTPLAHADGGAGRVRFRGPVQSQVERICRLAGVSRYFPALWPPR